MIKRATQRIRYVRTGDDVQVAWAEAGTGPLLIKAANWMTHLEYEWESPVWRHWIHFFTDHFRFVRHDERGCGMTDWNVGNLSYQAWLGDLEAVVDAVDPQEPFALLGISQGTATCLAYTVKHPERVSRLILYGGYARGTFRRGDPEKEQLYRALIDLTPKTARLVRANRPDEDVALDTKTRASALIEQAKIGEAALIAAPAESDASVILSVHPVGAPRSLGLSENEYWVLAMHTGSKPNPQSLNCCSLARALSLKATPAAP